MRTNSFYLLIGLLLLASLLLGGCAPSTSNPQTQAYPKYLPYGSKAASYRGSSAAAENSCRVHTVDLIAAWVNAGSPEQEPFPFTDVNSKNCQGTFEADILPLFTTANLWYAGALSCRTCHGPDTAVSQGALNLSSYAGLQAGSKNGAILGSDWQSSKLNQVFSVNLMPPNQPAGYDPLGPVITAGTAQ